MKVPFTDLPTEHAALRTEFRTTFEQVVESGNYAGGPLVESFERDFAKYCQADHAVGVGSGTDALWLTLEALGIGPGDEVITVPMTFIATVEAISRTGATPVFVDIEDASYTMDPELLRSAISSRTKAIMPVHLHGQAADLAAILEIAREHGVPVIEDAAQAHGARFASRRVGGIGAAGCFSFYPGKNLGALGEAGAVVTNDAEMAERIRILRDHGRSSQRNDHKVIGWNCRMDAIQASLLQVKLRHLDEWNEQRRRIAMRYHLRLDGLDGIVIPETAPGRTHVYHNYSIRVANRDFVRSRLEIEGVQTGMHYPVPVHLQEAYRHLGYRIGSFPTSERCADEFLSLPIYPSLTPSKIEFVGDSVSGLLPMKMSA